MMTVLECIEARKSIRSFENREIEAEKLDKVCLLYTSSASENGSPLKYFSMSSSSPIALSLIHI